MSAIKYQLQKILPSLGSQAQGFSEVEIKQRYKFLKAVGESKRSVAKKCREEGRSTQYFYKWAEVLIKAKSILSLKSRFRRPKKSPRQTPRRKVRRILKLRQLEPFSGLERISQDLKDLFKMHCPPSTV